MPLYLNERQVGFDTASIGFPGIGGCMALVLRDAGGLFGFHAMPGDKNKTANFLAFVVNNLNYQGPIQHIYSACRWDERYGGTGTRADWEAEVGKIAGKLGYTGTVTGFNAAVGTKLKHMESVYLEMRLNAGTVTFHHKRSSKMTNPVDGSGRDSPDTNLQEISLDKARINQNVKGGNPYKEFYQTTPKLVKGYSSSVTLTTATWGNKGELHQVPASKLVTCMV